MSFPMSTVIAQAAPAAAAPNPIMTFLPLIGLFVVFYFLMIRPQMKRQKEHRSMIDALAKGDEVATAGGLIGKVKDIKDDRITVESGTSTVIVERARIVRVGEHVSPTA